MVLRAVKAREFGGIDVEGTLAVDQGHVRQWDEPSSDTNGAEPFASPGGIIAVAGVEAEDAGEGDAVRPLPKQEIPETTRFPSNGAAHAAPLDGKPR